MTQVTTNVVQTPSGSKTVFQQRTMSLASLIENLSQNKGARIVTLITKTQPRLTKGHNLGEVFKVSRVNVVINFNYSNSVNRQMGREGMEQDFVAQPRKWGVRIAGTPFVSHNDKLYLEAKIEKSLDHRYEDEKGDVIDSAKVTPFLPASRKPFTQTQEKEIMLRDYDMNNIIGITMDNETYLITH
jgi:hypothetical protein